MVDSNNEAAKKLHSISHLPSPRSPLVVVVGPTGSGKTALAIRLAKKFNGEIICADSRTIYRGMDIGTAKPTAIEQSQVPHHLLDICSPDEPYSAAQFKRDAIRSIEDIQSRGGLPFLVGGSGLYIDAVVYDFDFSPPDTPRDTQNPRHASGKIEYAPRKLREDTLLLGLKVDRDLLKEQLGRRVDSMVDQGLVEEVDKLQAKYPASSALLAPGYKAFIKHLSGSVSLEEAKELFIRNDYQLAKRQQTWFKRDQNIQWLDSPDDADEAITTFLNNNRNVALLQ